MFITLSSLRAPFPSFSQLIRSPPPFLCRGGGLHLRSLCLCSHSISKTPARCDKLHPFTSVCTCKVLRCGHTRSSITVAQMTSCFLHVFLEKIDAVTGQKGAPSPFVSFKIKRISQKLDHCWLLLGCSHVSSAANPNCLILLFFIYF